MIGEHTAKILFWLGLVTMIVGVITNVYTLINAINVRDVGYNAGVFVISIFSPLWQGGLLIGVAKIIEILGSKRN